jgi:hypothetical protein
MAHSLAEDVSVFISKALSPYPINIDHIKVHVVAFSEPEEAAACKLMTTTHCPRQRYVTLLPAAEADIFVTLLDGTEVPIACPLRRKTTAEAMKVWSRCLEYISHIECCRQLA